MINDGALLKDYSRNGSESAFAELVHRHLDLVYATALRILSGNEFLAKDVAQSVFLDLARKASALSNRPVLTGWLHASVVYAAAKMVRSEVRRHAREQEAHAMQEAAKNPEEDLKWHELRPILDSLLLQMKEADRESLLLRFFDGRSLAEVGRRLGISENAARMRVERALAKLREVLERRGIRYSALALAAGLAHEPIAAAPAGLATTITSTIIGAGAQLGAGALTTSIIMSKGKTIVLGTLIATGVATPVIMQYQANTRLEQENQALRMQISQSSAQQPATIIDEAELARLREEWEELMRLRGKVAALQRERESSSSNAAPHAQSTTPEEAPGSEISETDVAQFLQQPLTEQARMLGNARGELWRTKTVNPDWARTRTLAEKIRPELERLESNPAEFAEFQTAFIQSAIGLEDETKLASIRSLIITTYEKAVAEHLDAASRPEEGVQEWATRRDALDRQATHQIQGMLSDQERRNFDALFLGLMGIDLGIGDGAWHRFETEDGVVVFPSETAR